MKTCFRIHNKARLMCHLISILMIVCTTDQVPILTCVKEGLCCSRLQFKPAELIHAPQELNKEFEELRKQSENVIASHKEIQSEIQKLMDSASKKIIHLQKEIGVELSVEKVPRSVLKDHNINCPED